MNLKFGDVTERGSTTFSDCHYVKKITFSLDYCLVSMFSIFWHIIKYSLSFVNIVIISVYLWGAPCILFYDDLLTS